MKIMIARPKIVAWERQRGGINGWLAAVESPGSGVVLLFAYRLDQVRGALQWRSYSRGEDPWDRRSSFPTDDNNDYARVLNERSGPILRRLASIQMSGRTNKSGTRMLANRVALLIGRDDVWAKVDSKGEGYTIGFGGFVRAWVSLNDALSLVELETRLRSSVERPWDWGKG